MHSLSHEVTTKCINKVSDRDRQGNRCTTYSHRLSIYYIHWALVNTHRHQQTVVHHTYWVTVLQDQAVHRHQQLYLTHTGSLSYRIKLYIGANSCTSHILSHCLTGSSCTWAPTVVSHTYWVTVLQVQTVHRHQQLYITHTGPLSYRIKLYIGTVVHHMYWVTVLQDQAVHRHQQTVVHHTYWVIVVQDLAVHRHQQTVVHYTYWVIVIQDQTVHGHQQTVVHHTYWVIVIQNQAVHWHQQTVVDHTYWVTVIQDQAVHGHQQTVVHHTYWVIVKQDQAVHGHQQTVVDHTYWVIVIQDPTKSTAHLLYVFLCTHVGRLQQVASESHVAVHSERLLRMVCVYPNTANVVNRLTGVTFLPHDIHITVKLTRVGCLKEYESDQLSNRLLLYIHFHSIKDILKMYIHAETSM